MTDRDQSSEQPKQGEASAAMDKMMDAHRVLGESRMIRTETDPKMITDEQVLEVITAVRAYQREKGIRNVTIARALFYTTTVISEVLSGKYGADPRPIVQAMDRWLERRKLADAKPETAKFIWTQVARQVRIAAQRAIASADMGIDSRIALVWGDPGCGKTLALQAIAESEDALLISCDFNAAGAGGLIEKIAAAIPRFHPSGSKRRLHEAVIARLRGSNTLIIVDEIHALLTARDDNPFHTLRRLSDDTGCPQLWSASCDLLSELRKREARREPLAQIIRRIGTQIHLTAPIQGHSGDGGRPLVSVEEVLQIYGGNEMKLTRDAAKFLSRLTTEPRQGLLGTCTSLVGHATAMNRMKAKELTVEMLWEAAQINCQPSEIESIYMIVKDELPVRQKKLG